MALQRQFQRHAPHGFTAIEMLVTVMILSIVTVIGVDSISTFEANQRAERAARESLAFFRYARNLAMTTGKNAKVQIDTTSNTVSVYWMTNGTTWDSTPASASFVSGGLMKIDLDESPELRGTAMVVSPTGTTAFTYGPLGACDTSGSITFSFGSKSKTLTIPAVGDPTLN